ncbi:MAG: phosphoribosylformylglycinamidine synthase subunit PurQ, partial [Syntrophorhabdaceae bacterium]|nr:phosphoribosylformylglycinamidine synthase subunit PurQ [Syntrophorhabdaceae bacterium]
SPDVEEPGVLKKTFEAVQRLILEDTILSGHDISDGGLIITILEMAFSGNCGVHIKMKANASPIERFFAEELGAVIECKKGDIDRVKKILEEYGLDYIEIGETIETKEVIIDYNGERILHADMRVLRSIWEETSYQIERLQTNPLCADREKRNIYDRKGPEYIITFVPEETPRHLIEVNDKPNVAILREEGSNGDREMTSAFYHAGFSPWDITMTDLIENKITLEKFRGVVAVGGFSYADVPESAKGWASVIRFNSRLKEMFDEFYRRPDTFSLGVCNGCQLFALLGWVPWQGIEDERQPRFVRNQSGRFESRWVTVKIKKSPAIMFEGMEGSILGVWVAHGEGRVYFPDPKIMEEVLKKNLVALTFVDDYGREDGFESDIYPYSYPFNPNGSPYGITGLCTEDGRHLAIMPHPERAFLKWQWPWMPEELNKSLKASPWLRMFQNARAWCDKVKR